MDGLSRRELLRYGAAAAALVLAPSGLACSGDPGRKSSPRIAFVGAGLAGLSCAYHLHRHGLSGSIFEANPERIGGRCWTARDFDRGQVAEHGGEFIDSRHKRMHTLVRRFQLELTDLYAEPFPGHPRRRSHTPGRRSGRV